MVDNNEITLSQRVLNRINKNRERILEGKLNCILSPFERFRKDFIGIEQGMYYCVTASTKGAKTQFCSYMFLFYPILVAYEHPELIRLKIFYFPLEESADDVMMRFMSFLLAKYDHIRISKDELDSKANALDPHIENLLNSERYKRTYDFFNKTIEFCDDANPYGIYKTCMDYAESHGTTHKNSFVKKNEWGVYETKNRFDYYIPNDEDEYKIIYIDHISLITQEKNTDLKKSIDKLSGEYLIKLRNRYNFTVVVIQQQSFANEDNQSVRAGQTRPTIAGLSDSKYPSRDCNICLGLFNPFKFQQKEFNGYDITRLKDNVRFLEVLVNRGGSPGGIEPLFFDGKTCTFRELPKTEDRVALEEWYKLAERIQQEG